MICNLIITKQVIWCQKINNEKYDFGETDVDGWTDIIQIASGSNHTLGLKKDGTVLASGDIQYGQCQVETWSHITNVAAGERHTVGLKEDGTVIATGDNEANQCAVDGWRLWEEY